MVDSRTIPTTVTWGCTLSTRKRVPSTRKRWFWVGNQRSTPDATVHNEYKKERREECWFWSAAWLFKRFQSDQIGLHVIGALLFEKYEIGSALDLRVYDHRPRSGTLQTHGTFHRAEANFVSDNKKTLKFKIAMTPSDYIVTFRSILQYKSKKHTLINEGSM